MRLISPTSHRLAFVLSNLEDITKLWSPWGLRSLSKSDQHFATKDNYWRGPIWVNFNYLALSALHYYGLATSGPYAGRAARMYADLRKNVVGNVVENYKATG